MFDRVKNEISFLPLFKQSALLFQIARIGLMFVIVHGARPVDVVSVGRTVDAMIVDAVGIKVAIVERFGLIATHRLHHSV